MQRVTGTKRKQQPITIRCRAVPDGELAVTLQTTGEVFGHWAVHKTALFDGRWSPTEYTVTHVPTGLALADQLSRDSALRLAEVLASVLDVEKFEPEKHVAIAMREIQRIRGWA